ncbi:NBR1-Ig-like domain-containing protein [Saccharopolyspora gloriosae]|uniref:NBR1-Ig-like domain-containing protein n=1 Tax=Saccharopolyspora gloriosae TaxID=455344 RepID=UPI001FB66666|nr:NBR1-Ig-like domain-containing protein [Saccharopolyspora gloriosae]
MSESEVGPATGGKRGRKQSRPDPADGPVAAFAYRLCELKESAGDPSYDRMRGDFGAAASKSALSSAARGQDLPSWETAWEFVRSLAVGVLGQDSETVRREWLRRWEHARAAAEQPAPAPAEAPEQPETPVPPVDHEPPSAEPDPESGPAGARRRGWILAGTGLAVVLVAIALSVYLLSGPERPIPGDASLMLSETVPDGTPIDAGTSFVKSWDIMNVGRVPWSGRYLEQTGERIGDAECTAPQRVWIRDTPPGGKVRVTVPVLAGETTGQCKIAWKMVDENGDLFFPDQALRPVFFDIEVTPRSN